MALNFDRTAHVSAGFYPPHVRLKLDEDAPADFQPDEARRIAGALLAAAKAAETPSEARLRPGSAQAVSHGCICSGEPTMVDGSPTYDVDRACPVHQALAPENVVEVGVLPGGQTVGMAAVVETSMGVRVCFDPGTGTQLAYSVQDARTLVAALARAVEHAEQMGAQ